MRKVLLVTLAIACGHRHDDKPLKAAVRAAGSAAAQPAEPPPAALPPAADLLAAVPADAGFAFVTLDPSDLPKRIFATLDGKALGDTARAALATPDPVARVGYAMWAELGGALATPDPLRTLGLGRRLAVYGVARAVVLRIELSDPAVAAATLARVMKAAGQPGTGPIDSGRGSLLVAISANQLVIAVGPRDAIHGAQAFLLGAAPAPVTEADLRKLAAEHGVDPRGIGWLDPTKLAAEVRQPGAFPELDDSPPACRTEIAALIESYDRITFGISELGPTRIGLSAAVPIDPKTAAAFATVIKAAPSLPAALPGKPWVAASYTAPPPVLSAAWTALGNKLTAACDGDGKTKSWSPPPPWDSMTAAALVVYGGEWKSILPDSIDGMLAVASPDPGKLLDAIGKLVPIATPPKDGGAFVDVPAAALGGFAPELGLARRGQVLVAASGPLGKAHVADFAVGSPAPLFRLVLDLGRMRRSQTDRLDDDEFYTAGGSFADQAHTDSILFGLFGTTSLAVELHGNEIRVQLAGDAAPHQAAPRPPADPRTAVRDQCRSILHHALAATAPALAKLGVTDQLDDIATTYVTSVEADGAIRSCAKLTAAQRACLAAAPDALNAAPRCAPNGDPFRASLELPPLFSFFGPRPLEAKLHPPIDGKALVGKLAGTWVHKTDFRSETWVVDGSGNVTITKQDTGSAAETEHGKLVADSAGMIEITEDDGSSRSSFFMPSADRFFEGNGDDLAPIVSTDRFLAPIGDGFLVREPGGCWVVTREGALVNASCKADQQKLTVNYQDHDATYRLFPGWIVATAIVDGGPFVRQR